MEKVGLRIFSEGKELNLGVEEKHEDLIGKVQWSQNTECPHCKKAITIYKWIEKWKGIIL